MVLPVTPRSGGFTRPIGLGEFIRLYLGAELEAPVLDPNTREITEFVTIQPRIGAPQHDIWARYKDFLFTAWGTEIVARWRRQGRQIPSPGPELDEVERVARARVPQRLRHMRLSSFYRYFHNVRRLGWVEPTGETEISDPFVTMGITYPTPSILEEGRSWGQTELQTDGRALVEIPQPRRFYRLTPTGQTEGADQGWRDPVKALYSQFDSAYFRSTVRAHRQRMGRLPPFAPRE